MIKPSPQIKFFAGFWTMIRQPDGNTATEWSSAQKIQEAKAAGFDAMGGGADATLAASVQAAGMEYICYVDANDSVYKTKLEAAAACHPARINVQLWDHDTPPRVATKTWIKMQPIAKKLKLEIDLEVHRDTCTETPEKTYAIADLYKQATGKNCRFCFDYSHFAVVKHIYPPYAPRLMDRPALLRPVRQIHLRPFNGHHCQVPATDGRGNPSSEIKPYLEFVDALFAAWLKGATGGEVLYVCPENGPDDGPNSGAGYGLSCFPNVWQDAIWLRREYAKLWKKNLAAWRR
ncbi:MAG: hypothetical protein WCS70_16675 [Verrucomicrobiota bacterium]